MVVGQRHRWHGVWICIALSVSLEAGAVGISSGSFSRAGANLNRFHYLAAGDTPAAMAARIYQSAERARELVEWNGPPATWTPGRVIFYQSPVDPYDVQMLPLSAEAQALPQPFVRIAPGSDPAAKPAPEPRLVAETKPLVKPGPAVQPKVEARPVVETRPKPALARRAPAEPVALWKPDPFPFQTGRAQPVAQAVRPTPVRGPTPRPEPLKVVSASLEPAKAAASAPAPAKVDREPLPAAAVVQAEAPAAKAEAAPVEPPRASRDVSYLLLANLTPGPWIALTSLALALLYFILSLVRRPGASAPSAAGRGAVPEGMNEEFSEYWKSQKLAAELDRSVGASSRRG